MKKITVGILGASGYTGTELIRILDRHPHVELTTLGAHSKAGQAAHEVFAHLPTDLPEMQRLEDMPLDTLDVLFAGLPHGSSAAILSKIFAEYPRLKILDLSADFRFDDAATYQAVYNLEHPDPALLSQAVYGASEFYREKIQAARIVACTGCYCITAELGLYPLLQAGLIETTDIIIDAKSGVSGAGRGAKPHLMFAEVNEGMHAYSVGTHRHLWEIEQELGKAAGEAIQVSFTPHLVPMTRGILSTSYVRLSPQARVDDLRSAMQKFYAEAPFVRVLPEGGLPKTQNVLGSNMLEMGVFADRPAGRAIVISALDNLQKGASGQAVQNMNIMCGFPETTGLDRLALYP